MKKIILVTLSVFLMAGLLFANATEKKENKQNNSKYIVYYFMYHPRCMTCNKIENSTKEIVFENFKKQLDSSEMEFKVIDIEKEGNEHFKTDFGLVSKSVVLVEVKDGKVLKYKVLQKIWELIHSPEKYKSYIIESVNNLIKKK